jgi:predicted HTH transcriptional regulator
MVTMNITFDNPTILPTLEALVTNLRGVKNVTVSNDSVAEILHACAKNPMIARVFKELSWVEELGSGRKNIRKYAPHYYENYKITIENGEKFGFAITYRNADDNVNDCHE